MKTLLLTFFLTTTALAANTVTVQVDGESFTCGKGGSGGGNQCECVSSSPSDGKWRWDAYKRGTRMNSNWYYSTQAEADGACRQYILSETSCYQ